MRRDPLTLALLAACALGAPAPADEAADAASIRAATRRFVEAFNARDMDGLLRFYADDYLDLNLPDPRQSTADRRLYLSRILARADTTLDVVPHEIVVTGEHAVVRGTIRLRRSLPDGASTTELRYMELMRRFPLGWKAVWGIDAEIYPEAR
jgi:ketosteroid isomerase-like protein